MEYAPIAVFAYNRPEHLLRTLTSLSECKLAEKSSLFIFCDGPRGGHDEAAIGEVRKVAAGSRWCAQVHVLSQEGNRGLARSIIDGVSHLSETFGRVIVLEDDMLLSRGFLKYINSALVRYEDEARVLQVTGHVFPFEPAPGSGDAYFMPVSTSQGWGTWKRSWDLFDPAATGWKKLRTDSTLRRRFDLDGVFPYNRMLQAQMAGEIDSWAIRWWWSFFENDGICLYPRKSLVFNIGFDSQGTHTTASDYYYNDEAWDRERYVPSMPEKVQVDQASYEALKKYLKKKRSFLNRLRNKLAAKLG